MFVYKNPHVQAFASFIEEERATWESDNGNLLALALGSVLRKYQKIWMLRERANPLIGQYGEQLAVRATWEPGPLSEEQKTHIANTSNLTAEIELLFESFFMYGAILCDDVAQLFNYLFGPARGIKFGSHRELAKNFLTYAQALSLAYDEELPRLADFLEVELCEYRDKQIVHDFHPRKMDAVSFNNGKRDVQMIYGLLYPKETDTYVISQNWGELLEALDRYVWLALNVVRANRSRTRFTSERKKQ